MPGPWRQSRKGPGIHVKEMGSAYSAADRNAGISTEGVSGSSVSPASAGMTASIPGVRSGSGNQFVSAKSRSACSAMSDYFSPSINSAI